MTHICRALPCLREHPVSHWFCSFTILGGTRAGIHMIIRWHRIPFYRKNKNVNLRVVKWVAWGHPAQNFIPLLWCLAPFAFLKLSRELLFDLQVLVTTSSCIFVLASRSITDSETRSSPRIFAAPKKCGDHEAVGTTSLHSRQARVWPQTLTAGSRGINNALIRIFSQKKKKVLKTNGNFWTSLSHGREGQDCLATYLSIAQTWMGTPQYCLSGKQ